MSEWLLSDCIIKHALFLEAFFWFHGSLPKRKKFVIHPDMADSIFRFLLGRRAACGWKGLSLTTLEYVSIACVNVVLADAGTVAEDGHLGHLLILVWKNEHLVLFILLLANGVARHVATLAQHVLASEWSRQVVVVRARGAVKVQTIAL